MATRLSLDALIARLAELDAEHRAAVIADLPPAEARALLRHLRAGPVSSHTMFARWLDDPVGFITDRLGEGLWSVQRQIAEAVRDHPRVAVPACHAPGKSHLAARLIAWWAAVHPPGQSMVVTTAPTFRQVRHILWPHIRRAHVHGRLPGEVLTTEWRVGAEVVAFGFSSRDNDEAAAQGIHAEHLLVVVDEAGGVSHALGRALESLTTGAHTRLLAIGNPPTDEEGSWFQAVCESPLWHTIPIPATITPRFTGEHHDLPEEVWRNLVDPRWVGDVRLLYGEDSAFYLARVLARFPEIVANAVIRHTWWEGACANDTPHPSERVTLGVDVAADGGDELVVARWEGNVGRVVFTSRGQANARALDVAGYVLSAIRDAEKLCRERGWAGPVRVKVDATGIGWGVADVLDAWGAEGMHDAEIVPVVVGERAGDSDRFANQRAEMWWTLRHLLEPGPDGQAPVARLEGMTHVEQAQATAMRWHTDSRGRVQIEPKAKLRARGRPSPDRVEALALGAYEPPGGGEVLIVV